ncbi:hypothetical protein RUND412_007065 [Rhizina undulata]
MTSSESLSSASPESKNTPYTPVIGHFDEFYPSLTPPSDLRLSPGDETYHEWNAIPSRLLDSPPPQEEKVEFRQGNSSAMYDSQKKEKQQQKRGNAANASAADAGDSLDNSAVFLNQGQESPEQTPGDISPRSAIARQYLEATKLEFERLQPSVAVGDHLLCPNHPDTAQEPVEWGFLSSRHLKIGNVPSTMSFPVIYKFLEEFGEIQEFYTNKLQAEGFFIASYFDIRDSVSAFSRIQAEKVWSVQFCSSGYVAVLTATGNVSPSNPSSREVMCIVSSGGNSPNVPGTLYEILSRFGDISKFTTLENTRPAAFLVSFFDGRNASNIVDILDGQYVEGFRLKVSFYDSDVLTWNRVFNTLRTRRDEKGRIHTISGSTPDMDIFCPQPIRPTFEFTVRRGSTDSLESTLSHEYDGERYDLGSGYQHRTQANALPKLPPMTLSRTSSGSHLFDRQVQEQYRRYPSLSPGSGYRNQEIHATATPGIPMDIYYARHIPSPIGPEKFATQPPVPGKNVIDLDRIARGLDTRTTVMLRNIPNKVDQQTLKEYVDTTSKGLYNFLYLRIDFRNICNVGYAFINFIDPLDIIEFVKAKSGTRWNKFNSEKVLDVTYANIQGIDQLIEKFRNSSVMDQDPSYRPKLFHSSGPFAGTEMEFPPANNILKKCRSISAAQQIGLFAPKMATTGKAIWRKRD